MLDQLIPTLVVAVLGALAWLAYYHPRQYGDLLSPILSVLLIAVLIVIGAWCAALFVAVQAAYSVKPTDLSGFDHTTRIVNAIQAYYPGYLYGCIVPAGVGLYLRLLELLPRLGLTNDARKEGKV